MFICEIGCKINQIERVITRPTVPRHCGRTRHGRRLGKPALFVFCSLPVRTISFPFPLMPTLPSPASSPSLKPAEVLPGASRKRQRSQSMQSDPSSSSPKRCVSECPSHDSGVRPPPGDLPQPPSLSDDRDHDIDAYMAEQEVVPLLDASALAPFPAQNGIVAAVSPEAKLSLVQNLSKKQMQVGDTWYLVSRQWYKRWQKACSGELDKEGPLEEKDVGPVNNSSLVDKDGNLVYAVEGIDVEYVPQEAWSYLISWFVHSRRNHISLSYDHTPSL